MDFNAAVRIILHCLCTPTGEQTPWDAANAITQKIENFINNADMPDSGSYVPDYKAVDSDSGVLRVVIDYADCSLAEIQTLITKFRASAEGLGPYTAPPWFRLIDQGELAE